MISAAAADFEQFPQLQKDAPFFRAMRKNGAPVYSDFGNAGYL
jgi:hypothetical protein